MRMIKSSAPRVGFEPTTFALTGRSSTAELPGNYIYPTSSSLVFQEFFTGALF